MPISSYQFIDPLTLTRISELSLLAKTVVDGFMIGKHLSPKPGTGLEFNQYRSYQPGDDLRRIDWKLFARSDRYYVRESEVETSITIRFVLDTSASMLHAEDGLTKFDYGRYIVACLAYLAHTQGDAIGLMGVNPQPAHLPAGRNHQHLHRFLHRLESLRCAGAWPAWQDLETGLTRGTSRDLLVIVTDFYESAGEIRNAIARLAALKHEILLFQVMAPGEMDLDLSRPRAFEDLETGRVVQTGAAQEKSTYQRRLQDFLAQIRRDMQDLGVDYALFTLDQPLDLALFQYLSKRGKLG